MKTVLLATFVLVSFLLLRSDGFQVTSPKLVFGPDETGLRIDAPSGGSSDDYIISTCRRDSTWDRPSTPFYKKKADGTYEIFLFPELQVCSSSYYGYATTNGKWIFVTNYTETEPRSSFASFYSLNNKSDLILATRYDEDPADLTNCYYATFIGETKLMTIVFGAFDNMAKLVEWNYDGSAWNKTLVQEVSALDFSNIAALTNPSFDPPTTIITPYIYYGAHLFSKQTDQWAVSAMFNKKDFESYEALSNNAPLFYNGNDTVIYLGGSNTKWSSGTMYIAEYQKNNTWHVVKTFNSEDINLDNEYLNIGYSWISSAVWINQDMAFLMAPNFPLKFNQTDWMYGGSVVMMYRDKLNQWQMGGRITLPDDDGTGEAVQLTYVTRTKNDVIITGVVTNDQYPTKYVLYSYPLCFPNKMNFTCHQNVSASSCSETDVTLPSDVRVIAHYTDDKCGEPFATVSHVEIVDLTATADLKFERLGFEVGQCTATFFCPPPPPLPPVSSPPKVSGAVLLGFSCADIARLVTFITITISLVL